MSEQTKTSLWCAFTAYGAFQGSMETVAGGWHDQKLTSGSRELSWMASDIGA